MKRQILVNDIPINYIDTGNGPALFFLHGYLESYKIWETFIPLLNHDFRTIAIDIPGHGESGTTGGTHSMEQMAYFIRAVAKDAGIEKLSLIGHSMGGYIALAFLEKYPQILEGLVLFHSHPFPDGEQAAIKRDREINLVLEGKKNILAKNNIPNAFAKQNLKRLELEIEMAKQIAIKNNDHGILALLKGMKNRKDRSSLLSETKIPTLIIHGDKDNYIAKETIEKIKMPKKGKLLILEETGHMGFLEEPKKCAENIKEFAFNIQKTVHKSFI